MAPNCQSSDSLMCVTVGFLGLLLRIPSGPQEGRNASSGLALFQDQAAQVRATCKHHATTTVLIKYVGMDERWISGG